MARRRAKPKKRVSGARRRLKRITRREQRWISTKIAYLIREEHRSPKQAAAIRVLDDGRDA